MKKIINHSKIRYLTRFNPLIILLPLALLYLSQNLYLPVTSMDEAQQADYLQRIVDGRLPYIDFLDIYGPINWLPPAAAYKLFGEKWFGVRVWMLFIQVLILFLGYKITKFTTDKFYAICFFIICLFFLGVPITQNYTPYAYMQMYPLMFGVIFLILKQKNQTKLLLFAGILTGTTIFLKISSGLFLWLSVLLICFFNVIPQSNKDVKPALNSIFFAKLLFFAKYIVAVCYLFVFTVYIIPHYEKQYFWHLTFPLLIGIFALLYMENRRYIKSPVYCYIKDDLRRIKNCIIFGLSTVLTVMFFMILFFPSGITGDMIDIFPKILKEINYFLSFAPLGILPMTAMETVLTNGCWMQLPWIATFLFLLIFFSFLLSNENIFQKKNIQSIRFIKSIQSWKSRDFFKCIIIWIVAVLCHYVIYPTADQGHLIQSTILWILFFCTGISFFERFAINVRWRFFFRILTASLLICWIIPLFNFGTFIGFDLLKKNIFIPDLEASSYLLKYHDKQNSYSHYKKLVEIGQFIRNNSKIEDECFILSKDKLINFYAGKELYGSKDSFLFYLIPHGRLSRKSFINLSDSKTLKKLLNDSPKFIIDHNFNGGDVTKKVFPELRNLIANRYEKVFFKSQIIVYKRNDKG